MRVAVYVIFYTINEENSHEPMGVQFNRNELARVLQGNLSSCKVLQDKYLLQEI